MHKNESIDHNYVTRRQNFYSTSKFVCELPPLNSVYILSKMKNMRQSDTTNKMYLDSLNVLRYLYNIRT